MLEKIRQFLIKSLTTHVSPMVYVMMFVSIFIGFCFFTGFLVSGGESILFSASEHILQPKIWGALLFVTASVCEYGLATKKWRLVSYGALGGFALWLLASIDLFMSGHYYAMFTLGIFHWVFHMYVYLSASLGVLERSSIHGNDA